MEQRWWGKRLAQRWHSSAALLLAMLMLPFYGLRAYHANATAVELLHILSTSCADCVGAKQLLQIGARPDSEDECRRGAWSQPSQVRQRLAGTVALYKGCLVEAVSLLQGAQAHDPSPVAGYFLGWAFWGLGRQEQATRIWKQIGAARLLSRSADADCETPDSASDQLWQLAFQSARSDAEAAAAYSDQGWCNTRKPDWERALERYQLALVSDPASVEANYWAAWILAQIKAQPEGNALERAHTALASLDDSSEDEEELARRGIDRLRIVLLVADVSGASGHHQDAWRYLEQAHALERQSWMVDYYRARQYAREGRIDDALIYFREAIHKEPRQPPLYRELGLLYMRAGRFQEAAATLRTLTRISPSANAWNLLGDAYRELRDCQNARDAYVQAAALLPRTARTQAALDRRLAAVTTHCR